MTQMHDSKPTRGCLSAPGGGGRGAPRLSHFRKVPGSEGDRKPPGRVRECARAASARHAPPATPASPRLASQSDLAFRARARAPGAARDRHLSGPRSARFRAHAQPPGDG